MILRLPCLAPLLSLAAEALQAPSNAHIAITGPAPLAKAVGAGPVMATWAFCGAWSAAARESRPSVRESMVDSALCYACSCLYGLRLLCTRCLLHVGCNP